MVNGISGTTNTSNIKYQPSYELKPDEKVDRPLNSFDDEDQAIISAEAKLQYETEKYNSGKGNELDLALTSIKTQNQVEANVNVINTKKKMLDSLLGLDST